MYKTQYILPFTNDLNEFYEIYFERLNFVGDVVNLIGAEAALTLRCTAGDESKVTPILGTECLIGIWAEEDTPITLEDLVATEDNEIRITIFRDEDYTKVVFQGFIVVEDNSEPFLDRPYAINIRALDGLGLLKGVDLVDTNGLKFKGNFSILYWIAQILYKTDQVLNLRVYFNIYEKSFNENINALEQAFLNSITFSQGDSFNVNSNDPSVDINATTADDCYTALEKIVRCCRCRLFQEDGVWNLVNLYEYFNPAGFSFREYTIGNPVNGIVQANAVDTKSNLNYSVVVGKNQIIHPINEDQLFYLKIATKWVKLTYTYDQSQNKICNQDFTEGDRNATYDEVISSSILDPTIQPVVNLKTEGYDLYCWDHFNGVIEASVQDNPLPKQAPTRRAFIRSVLDQLDYEKERFVVLENATAPTYLWASTFYIDTSDALQISVTARWRNNNPGVAGYGNILILLTGDDGTFWAVNGSEGPGITDPISNKAVWLQTDNQFRTAASGFHGTPGYGYEGGAGSKSTDWATFSPGSAYSLITPVSGTIQVILSCFHNATANEQWYKALQITITPYLNGAYKALKGDYNFSSSNLNIKQTESDDVEISDSPKRYFKGALLKFDGSLCSPDWHRVGNVEHFRFTQFMDYLLYTNLYRKLRKIEGSFRGLVYLPIDDIYHLRMNGFLGSYTFEDSDNPTKRYMLTSFEKDYTTGQWRGVFVETLKDQNDIFIIPSVFKFDYLFQ